jgi:hypothetical protein
MPLVRLAAAPGATKISFQVNVHNAIKVSSAARKIWDYLQQQKCEFDVVILGRGQNFGQMLTEQDQSSADVAGARDVYRQVFSTPRNPASKIIRPVVLWNPDYQFEYFGNVEGAKIEPNGDIKPLGPREPGGYVYKYKTAFSVTTRVIRLTRAKMASWIVLFHELGHTKQFWEGGATLAQAEQAWLTRLGKTAAIEADNLAHHENPMCADVRIAPRAHYKHNTFGLNDLLRGYGQETYDAGGTALPAAKTGKTGAWKEASSPDARRTLENELRIEAEENKKANAETGIFAV